MNKKRLSEKAAEYRVPVNLVERVKQEGRLPVVTFVAGGIATPADAAMMRQLGAQAIFVGSGVFKSGDPAKRARAIVLAATHYQDPVLLAEISEALGEAMVGIGISTLPAQA